MVQHPHILNRPNTATKRVTQVCLRGETARETSCVLIHNVDMLLPHVVGVPKYPLNVRLDPQPRPMKMI
jgi:hypothetical protein